MKKLNKILFVVIAGLFTAGIASASLGEYWSTISHIIPRTDSTVDIGSNAKKVKAIWTDAFYGDYWISGTGNSMNVQPTGDTDDFFSFKTPANRPTIKREGGKYIYIESSNVNDVGISFRKDADHSGTVNYYKDTNEFGLTSKDPLVFKVCADYDDYVKICAASNVPEMSTVGAADFKINAGGANDLLLNHSGGNVGIGTTTPSSVLEVNGTATFNENIEMKDDKKLYFDTAKSRYIEYNPAIGSLVLGDSNGLSSVGGLLLSSNCGADGLGSYEPFLFFQSDGSVAIQNELEGVAAARFFHITMNAGIRLSTTGSGGKFAILKADNIATADKTFQFPNYSGTFITSGNLTDITTVGTIAAGTWNGTALTDANVSNTLTVDGYMQDTDIDTFAELQSWAVGYTDNDTTYVSSDFTHDDLTGFVANEHIDWTGDQGAVNIHAGNYTDTNTTYLGGTNLTLAGTTFNVDDAFLANDGDVGTGVYDFGGATSIEIPNGAPTIDGVGEIGVDTTSDQFLYYGASKRVVPYYHEKCFTIEDIADADDNVPIWSPHKAITITDVYCRTQGGTSAVITISDGTNALEAVTCDADGQADDGSITNGAFTANERMEFDTGTVTGAVDWTNFCITYTITAD